MTTTQSRVLRGVPAGGQFSEKLQSESTVSLSGPRVETDWVAAKIAEDPVIADTPPEMLPAITERLNQSQNFSPDNVHDETVAQWMTDRGMHPVEEAAYQNALAKLDALDASAAKDIRTYVQLTRSHQGNTPVETRPAPEPGPEGAAQPNNYFLQTGKVFDKVQAPDGTVFHRSRPGTYPDTPYQMRFQANRRITEQEAQHLAQLIGYGYGSTVRGEQLGWPETDTPFSFIVSADTTKGSPERLQDFEEQLPQLIAEGSRLRTSDRSGPGTKGTRLVEAFPDSDLKLEIYYDSVYQPGS